MSAETKALAVFGPSRIASPSSLFHRFLPVTILAFGVLLLVGWTGLLGYGLFELAELAF
jgi:hypothetical protein